jgi:5-methylcytosine-specific restriction enzyme A
MARSDHRNTWDRWYQCARWERLRAYQLREHPLCAICAQQGIVTPATIADHVEPHRGDWTEFVTGKLQSLCKRCHDSIKKMIEARGYSTKIGVDGWPVDDQHPCYKGSKV